MADFVRADLHGSRFERVDLSGAQLRAVDLTGARFRGVELSGVVMRGVELVDVDIHGEIHNVTVNGVDIAPLVNAELNRRYPGLAKMRPADPAGFREAWDILERLWGQTVVRARRLQPELLHKSVDGEWSFIETQRHLVFATDSWIRRAILGDPSPWDPLDLPWDEMPDTPGVPRDRDARPSLDAVLELRRDRMSTVRQVIEGLTDGSLEATPNRWRGRAGPSPAVTRCVSACSASSTKNGSTGCTPSETWTPWYRAAPSGGAWRPPQGPAFVSVMMTSRACLRVQASRPLPTFNSFSALFPATLIGVTVFECLSARRARASGCRERM
jgi:uncharacterized protein YjbI with pentapeptide repeats